MEEVPYTMVLDYKQAAKDRKAAMQAEGQLYDYQDRFELAAEQAKREAAEQKLAEVDWNQYSLPRAKWGNAPELYDYIQSIHDHAASQAAEKERKRKLENPTNEERIRKIKSEIESAQFMVGKYEKDIAEAQRGLQFNRNKIVQLQRQLDELEVDLISDAHFDNFAMHVLNRLTSSMHLLYK